MTRHTVVRAGLGSAVALTVALGAAGCTSASSSKSTAALPAAGTGGAAPAIARAGAPVAGVIAAPAASAAAAASAPANNGAVENRPAFQADPTAGRSIIYTATVDVQVKTPALVVQQANQAERDAEAANGYVFSRDGQAADSGTTAVPPGQTPAPAGVAVADITIKVPPASYGSLLVELENLGTQQSLEQHSQDVTDQVVDSQARLSTLKASVARVRTLLDKATTIGEIVSVEGELTKREADLEAMEGRLNVLKAQSALATITLHLESAPPKTAVIPPMPKPKPKPPIHGFVSGLRAGGRGFATVVVGVATVVGAVLPFAALLLALTLLAWWARRAWHKARRPGSPAEAATP